VSCHTQLEALLAVDHRWRALVKPSVFIGSSSEALQAADALFEHLEQDANVYVWDGDIFKPSVDGLTSLMDAASQADFAVFVFSGDDISHSKQMEQLAPRDNVVFELGLFMGKLGPERTFIVVDREDKPKIPTDLLGITTLSYRKAGFVDPVAPLTGVASRIRRRIQALGSHPARTPPKPTIYWCGPHYSPYNAEAADIFRLNGIDVKMPTELVPSDTVGNVAEVQRTCRQAIRESDLVVVDLDTYGLDSAWEMGYAEALGVRVVGLSRNTASVDESRTIAKRLYRDNIMHGWDRHEVCTNLDQVADRCTHKTVMVCCPYANETALQAINESPIISSAQRVLFSADILGLDPAHPQAYPWRAREGALRLVRKADIMLTVLPRYGMDTAWKLGYAEGFGKHVIGWVTDDASAATSEARFIDHWMHGWKRKLWVTDIHDLIAFARGFTTIQ
jgi:nucleoside 2-deoxyribosyltransferase